MPKSITLNGKQAALTSVFLVLILGGGTFVVANTEMVERPPRHRTGSIDFSDCYWRNTMDTDSTSETVSASWSLISGGCYGFLVDLDVNNPLDGKLECSGTDETGWLEADEPSTGAIILDCPVDNYPEEVTSWQIGDSKCFTESEIETYYKELKDRPCETFCEMVASDFDEVDDLTCDPDAKCAHDTAHMGGDDGPWYPSEYYRLRARNQRKCDNPPDGDPLFGDWELSACGCKPA